MSKKQLSLNPKLLALIPALLLIFLTIQLLNNGFSLSYLFLIVLLAFLVFIAFNSKQLFYDDEYLYQIKKGSEKKISLRDVISVKATMTSIGGWSVWKIKYIDSDKKTKSLRFMPYGFRNRVFDFSKTTKIKNKDLIFTTFSSSFDFDQ